MTLPYMGAHGIMPAPAPHPSMVPEQRRPMARPQSISDVLRNMASLQTPENQSMRGVAGDVMAGMVPGIGEVQGVRDAVRDFGEGRPGWGTVSSVSAIPLLGWPARALRRGKAATKAARKVTSGFDAIDDVRRPVSGMSATDLHQRVRAIDAGGYQNLTPNQRNRMRSEAQNAIWMRVRGSPSASQARRVGAAETTAARPVLRSADAPPGVTPARAAPSSTPKDSGITEMAQLMFDTYGQKEGQRLFLKAMENLHGPLPVPVSRPASGEIMRGLEQMGAFPPSGGNR